MPKSVIRFVHADELTFCRVLRYLGIIVSMDEARSRNGIQVDGTSTSRSLISTDYRSTPAAPTVFIMIDTSDLVEHIGGLSEGV